MTEAEERHAFVQRHLARAVAGVATRPDVDPSAIVLFVLDAGDPLGSAFAASLGVDVARARSEQAEPAASFAVFASSPLGPAGALLRTMKQPKIAEAIEQLPIPPRAVRVVGVAFGGAAATAAVLPELCRIR
jgi:hypothetical protein